MSTYQTPDVSVVIPAYNSQRSINRAIDSVLSQDKDLLKEIIVVNDGSTDNTAEFVRSYDSPLITYIEQENQGPAVARNKGIELAMGKYISFLDADDYWKPGFLKKTVEFLENNKEPVAVSVGQIHKLLGEKERISPSILNNGSISFSSPVILEDFYRFWGEYNHVCTGSVLMRTDIVKATGGQRPELRISQDLEFWAYLASFGPWGFIPEILFVSDGIEVSRQIGWFEKNRRRWASAPPVPEWEKRIISRLGDDIPDGYQKVRGRIARNLTYCMILSDRPKLARKTIRKYGSHLPSGKLNSLFRIAASFYPLWYILCKVIVYRETKRKL